MKKVVKKTVSKKPKMQSGGVKKNTNSSTKSNKDKWGRSPSSKWYGFDPNKKKYVEGPKTTKNLQKILLSPNAKIAMRDPDPDRSYTDSIRYDRGNITSLGIPYVKDYPGVEGISGSYPGDKAIIKAAQKGTVRIYEEKKKGGSIMKKGGLIKTKKKK